MGPSTITWVKANVKTCTHLPRKFFGEHAVLGSTAGVALTPLASDCYHCILALTERCMSNMYCRSFHTDAV